MPIVIPLLPATSTALTSILPYVLPELPSAPTPLVLQYAGKVIDDFCRVTKCWQTENTAVVAASDRDYILTAPTDAKLATVLTVTLDSYQLYPTTRDLLLQGNPAWQTDTGSPDSFFVTLPLTVELVPLPDASVNGDTLTVRASWTLLTTATTWDTDLLERHMHVIAAGIKGQMMLMQGQPWSNPQGGQYEAEYAEGRRNRRIEVMGGPQVRNIAVRKPRFA